MADILPFRPYRYTPKAGALESLVTQPYDKISPEMQRRYLEASPHNFVRIILGERRAEDSESNNVYTRAAGYLNDWIAQGILAPDPEPAYYACFQEFAVPDTNETAVRKGLICLGPVTDYADGVVYPHERTLRGPKLDRLQLLRHIRAHTGQLFLLYSDPQQAVDQILDAAAAAEPLMETADEYGVTHRVWRIAEPERTAEITRLMADKKLLIADGHHRYETANAFRRENPELAAARHAMMTLVNMDAPGLTILATHRLVHGLDGFTGEGFLARAAAAFSVERVASADRMKELLAAAETGRSRIGVALDGGSKLALLEAANPNGLLDVAVLHQQVLDALLGIDEEAVREQRHVGYMRGLAPAVEAVRRGEAQAAFLLPPTSVKQVADISFAGGVMPQKSTDFYPKLLSGLMLYKMETE